MNIGLTGTLASGKGVVAHYLKEIGFAYFSLGDEIREIAKQEGIEITRKNLQDLGNKLRNEKGGGAVAEIVSEKIIRYGYENAIIDSIRSPYEIEALKKLNNFFLVSVDAPWMSRFERIKGRDRESDPTTLEDFLRVEKRDFGELDKMGQQVGLSMRLADFKIFNDGDLLYLERQVVEVYNQILKKITIPSWDDYYLNIAKEVSKRSKDPSTKVGAVIVRPDNSLCSTGYNGFPKWMPDNPELYANREEKYSRTIHGEKNAREFSRDPSHEGYTLYTWPMLSCDRCFVEMAQAGITRFVAPIPTQDALSRWGPIIEKVKKYAEEMRKKGRKIELVEK